MPQIPLNLAPFNPGLRFHGSSCRGHRNQTYCSALATNDEPELPLGGPLRFAAAFFSLGFSDANHNLTQTRFHQTRSSRNPSSKGHESPAYLMISLPQTLCPTSFTACIFSHF